MEAWFVIIVTTCIAWLLKVFISIFQSNSNYPPGPRGLPILTTLQWLRKSSTEIEATLRTLRPKFGPIITIHTITNPLIFISSSQLAHEALVHKGATFADRPKSLPAQIALNSNQHSISSAGYGPTWRILRRNLTSQILHPSKVNGYSHARKWVIDILLSNLKQGGANSNNRVVKVIDHFRFSMFCLLVLMCFGDKLDESKIKEIEEIQLRVLLSFTRFRILNFCPPVTRILLRCRWNELFMLRKKQMEILSPLIRARKGGAAKIEANSYVDTLLALELQDVDGESKRKLSDEELATACSEFLNAGTDTTSTGLQWIMANLVKYPNIQAKVYDEIKEVVGANADEIMVDDLSKMPYLKAVVLEGLRRHPPAHFLLPHTVTQEVELGGYTIPKNAVINFTLAEMGWDPKVWDDPMQFKPERFMSNGQVLEQQSFDITGSREIKMIPFGAGRRICPGFGLAILHLQYFVANLVLKFEWEAVDEVDLSEKQEFTTVMKYPLHARISPRQIS